MRPARAATRACSSGLFERWSTSALAQPAAFVHRDYHSRNLLVSDGRNPGILDFQDAVRGAVTYDLVSLLKDCYIAWPRERVRGWVARLPRRLLDAGFAPAPSEHEFIRWFDLMGLQRHIKVLGIFARLYYRDGKARIPRGPAARARATREAAALYPETAELSEYIARAYRSGISRARRSARRRRREMRPSTGYAGTRRPGTRRPSTRAPR